MGEAGGGDDPVVEDDDAVRAYGTEVLRELGYHVLEAPNAGAALEILDRQADVHLLFTDIGLPGAMNGRQLSDEARRRRSGLKVLLATGYAGNAVIHAGQLEPGVSLMSKPFSFADPDEEGARRIGWMRQQLIPLSTINMQRTESDAGR